MKDKNQLLSWQNEIGVDEVITYEPVDNTKVIEKPTSVISEPNIPFSVSRQIAESATDINDLFNKIREFDGCSLKKLSTNTVVGEGVTSSQIMLIGEAPGEQEDKEGRPFCGPSGELLSEMLAAINLYREKNFFITNNIFWRPPANRKPTNEELTICLPFLEKMISLINPKLIIAVGSVAATNLTGLNYNMVQFRSTDILYHNKYLEQPIKTFTIYHPAFLLRSPFNKKIAWFDLLNIEQFIKSCNIKL